MKPARHNKVLGLAIGEQSMLAAEVAQGDKLEVKRLAEFVYPAGVTFAQPAELGAALGDFLRTNNFSARTAAIGLPAKWLAVKTKDVPPADAATLANILRLQAEGDFSAELKELAYDFAPLSAGGGSPGGTSSVLLFATPKKYVTAAEKMCLAAKLSVAAVTPSVIALSSATSRALGKDAMVLAVEAGRTEFAAQTGGTPAAMLTLRSATTGELRRAVSGVPASAGMSTTAGNSMPAEAGTPNSNSRELVLWDAVGVDADTLGRGLGVTIRAADLPSLGVEVNGAMTGSGPAQGSARRFAAAVAVAIESLGDRTAAIDFLHSRLAPPKKPLVPRWAVYTAAALVLVIVCVALAYNNLQNQQQQLTADKAKIEAMKGDIAAATAFVDKVTFAQAWHSGDARYLALVRDLTIALPDDLATYATNLQVHEVTKLVKGKSIQTGLLAGTLSGRTSDQQRAKQVVDAIRTLPAFTDVKTGGTQDAGRSREVSYSITFTYKPGKG